MNLFHWNIQKRIFLYIVSITILCVFVSGASITYFVTKEYIADEVENSLNTAIKTKQNIEFIFRMANELAFGLIQDENLNKLLDDNISNQEYESALEDVNFLIENIKVQKLYKNVSILVFDSHRIDSINKEKQEQYKLSFFEQEYNELILKEKLSEQDYLVDYKNDVFEFVRPIYSQNGEIKGAVIVELDANYIKETFASSSYEYSDEKIIIVNDSSEIILSFPNSTDFHDILKENPQLIKYNTHEINKNVFGRKSILVSDSIKYTNWKIIRIINMDKTNKTVTYINLIVIIILIIFLLIAMVMSYFLSLSITKPIIKLNNSVSEVEKGNFSETLPITSKDEIGELTRSFNNMVIQLNQSIETIIDNEKRKAELQLEILQAQINPHFLYNTLDSIRWLAIIHNETNISEMTLAIINLLKYNISKKSQIVKVEEEIKCIQNYITIQKYRYGKDIQIEFDVDTIEDYKVLKFVLQPLIENCIYHGFNSLNIQGLIKITGYVNNNELIIKVIDNGKGINSNINIESKSKMHTGIGIDSIKQRIKLYFGDQYGIALVNLQKGTEVTINLPTIEDD